MISCELGEFGLGGAVRLMVGIARGRGDNSPRHPSRMTGLRPVDCRRFVDFSGVPRFPSAPVVHAETDARGQQVGAVIEREETPPTLGVQAGLWAIRWRIALRRSRRRWRPRASGTTFSARSIGSRRPMTSSSYSEQLTYFDNHEFKKHPTSGSGHIQVFESTVPYRDW